MDCRVTGLGGVFFKCEDPTALMAWYRENLGMECADFGAVFLWREEKQPDEVGYTVWAPFRRDSSKFESTDKELMVNYRVTGLEKLIETLRQRGVTVVGEVEAHPNGKFAWILDPFANKLELWEPVPSAEDPYLPR